mmetsp:Transcript_3988/g.9269  ORF Transcript_3988/g.9269 Transcript_3988/m.9269 type:complete len:396 (+) Transcript_3988:151-1338(+)
MDPSKDSGMFDGAPPLGGLGNFKGVMLCNRPADADPSAKIAGSENQPFKSAVSSKFGEQIGLTPCKTGKELKGVKTRGPSAALRRHVKWLKELQCQMRDERDQAEIEDRQEEERKQRLKAICEKHRDGVREMIAAEKPALPAEAATSKAAPSAVPSAAKKAPKPLWAMTEKEKESFEEGEADELLNFVDKLDYEKFMDDLEFRQSVNALKDRTGKLKKEQDAFKDALVKDFNAACMEDEESTSAGGSPRSAKQLEDGIDGQSLLGDQRSEYSTASRRSKGAERYNADGRHEWDNSTACDEKPEIDRDTKDLAERVLESNPQMKAVHSKESVQRIVEKNRAKQEAEASRPFSLVGEMRRELPAPVPVIVASADTQTRLNKPVDPSVLPYLYRSPAI